MPTSYNWGSWASASSTGSAVALGVKRRDKLDLQNPCSSFQVALLERVKRLRALVIHSIMALQPTLSLSHLWSLEETRAGQRRTPRCAFRLLRAPLEFLKMKIQEMWTPEVQKWSQMTKKHPHWRPREIRT